MANIIKPNQNAHIDSTDYVLNLLPKTKRKLAEKHLSQCDECLNAVATDRALELMVRDTVQALPTPSDAALMRLMPAPPPSNFYRPVASAAPSAPILSTFRWWQPAFSMCLVLMLFMGTFTLRSPSAAVIEGTSTSTTTATMTATQVVYTATSIANQTENITSNLTPAPLATPIAQLAPLRASQIDPSQ